MKPHYLLILAAGLLVAADDERGERRALSGSYKLVRVEQDGREKPLLRQSLVIDPSEIVFTTRYSDIQEVEANSGYDLNLDRDPPTIAFTHYDQRMEGYEVEAIYSLKDDLFIIAINDRNPTKPPARFSTKADPDTIVYVYQRTGR